MFSYVCCMLAVVATTSASLINVGCCPYSGIGGGRVIADNCECVKTVLKPQLNQRIIDVPSVRPAIQTVVRPVIESFNYNKNLPVSGCCASPLNLAGNYAPGLDFVSNCASPLDVVGNCAPAFDISGGGALDVAASAVPAINLASSGLVSDAFCNTPSVVGCNSYLGAGRVISDTCDCVKTVVRPSLNQRVFDVPAIRRECRTTVNPVFETINYNRPGCGRRIIDAVPSCNGYLGGSIYGDVPSVGIAPPCY